MVKNRAHQGKITSSSLSDTQWSKHQEFTLEAALSGSASRQEVGGARARQGAGGGSPGKFFRVTPFQNQGNAFFNAGERRATPPFSHRICMDLRYHLSEKVGGLVPSIPTPLVPPLAALMVKVLFQDQISSNL